MTQPFQPLFRFLLLLVMCIASPAYAHDLGLAQVTVSSTENGEVFMRSRLSATLEALPPQLPEACTADTVIVAAPDRKNHIIETRFTCPKDIVDGEVLLPWKVNGVFLKSLMVDAQDVSQFLPSGPNGVSIPLEDLVTIDRSTFETAVLYVELGVEHILIGLDHLALLLCLSMLARGYALVRLVTAFTIGHSITLIIAALRPSIIPTAPVEVLIVISVAWLAREVWLGRKLSRDSTALLVGIGLLHGLGFASVLNEIGLPSLQLFTALICFNLGIEIGQLIFLAAAITLPWIVTQIVELPQVIPFRRISAFCLGTVAMYWSFERLAGFII